MTKSARAKGMLTNLASEFYVASCLFRLGHVCTITLGHTKEIDLVVASPSGKTVTIDVKGLRSQTNWPVKKDHLIRPGHFLVFLTYKTDKRFRDPSSAPEVYVVPSRHVTSLLSEFGGGRTGVKYSALRGSKFRDAWHKLGLGDAEQATGREAACCGSDHS